MESIDAVCIGTPDHWHHRQIVDSLKAGKHVYAEKPMTKTVEEAIDVVKVWKETGRVMQVGVQSTSLEVWDQARQLIDAGKLGKVLGYQTEYFRNSAMGQWRSYKLEKEMTPETIDWKQWLGVSAGLAPEMDFDRAIYKQWRCYWPFGSGMLTDLFVHRTTAMLKATGLRYPARVVGAGGIYLELDTREIPDVATKVYHFDAASGSYTDGNPGWAKKWEAMSKARAQPNHVPGWQAGDTGSTIRPPAYQSLGGPWVGGKDPAGA